MEKMYFALTWLLSVGVAYAFGWWKGVKSVTQVAAGAASSGFSLILIVLAIVAVVSSVLAFRLKSYLGRKGDDPAISSRPS
jgi:hypothetical protein